MFSTTSKQPKAGVENIELREQDEHSWGEKGSKEKLEHFDNEVIRASLQKSVQK